MEQGGSGRPVLVLRTPFPEGLERPAEPEKPICNIRAYRVHKLRRRNGCRLVPVLEHLPRKGSRT